MNVLVSNAGFLPATGPIIDEDLNEAWKGFETNVRGTFNVVQNFLRTAAPKTILINVSTGVAHVPITYHSSYGSSKAAVLSWLDHVQRENEGIRVTTFHPGIVATNMNAKSGIPAEDDGKQLLSCSHVWMTG